LFSQFFLEIATTIGLNMLSKYLTHATTDNTNCIKTFNLSNVLTNSGNRPVMPLMTRDKTGTKQGQARTSRDKTGTSRDKKGTSGTIQGP
jgi:hypothetical protein